MKDTPTSVDLFDREITIDGAVYNIEVVNGGIENVKDGVRCIAYKLNTLWGSPEKGKDIAIGAIDIGKASDVQMVGEGYKVEESAYIGNGCLVFLRYGSKSINYHYTSGGEGNGTLPLKFGANDLISWVALPNGTNSSFMFVEKVTPIFKKQETFKEGSEIDPVRFKLMQDAVNQLLGIEA